MTIRAASGSAHERYRVRIGRVLAATTAGPIGRPPAPGWTVHMARFHPGRGPWATVVQHGPRPAELVTAELFDDDDIPHDAAQTAAGPAVVRTFPHDVALPSLPRLLATVDEVAVVRYRPGSRCTVRADTPCGLRWLKVCGAGIDARRAADAAARWRASVRGELGFVVAEPFAVDVAGGAEWQAAVPGRPIADDLGRPGAAELVHRLGAALATLSRSSLAPSRMTTRFDVLARADRGVRRVERTIPPLADALAEHVVRLGDALALLPAPRAVPIHGSPHEHQWLIDGEGCLGLVDFDRWARGEPELDAATFLGELAFESGVADEVGALEAALVRGYGDGGVPLDQRVLDWYLSLRLLAKVVRTTTALRVDGDGRAARHLLTVARILANR